MITDAEAGIVRTNVVVIVLCVFADDADAFEAAFWAVIAASCREIGPCELPVEMSCRECATPPVEII